MQTDTEINESLLRLLEERIQFMREANRKLDRVSEDAHALERKGMKQLALARLESEEVSEAQADYTRARDAASGIIDLLNKRTASDS